MTFRVRCAGGLFRALHPTLHPSVPPPSTPLVPGCSTVHPGPSCSLLLWSSLLHTDAGMVMVMECVCVGGGGESQAHISCQGSVCGRLMMATGAHISWEHGASFRSPHLAGLTYRRWFSATPQVCEVSGHLWSLPPSEAGF